MAVTQIAPTSIEPPSRVSPPRAKRPPASRGVFGGLSHVALAVWAITVIVPILWTFLASFKTNDEIFGDHPLALPHSISFASWGRAWDKAHIGLYLFNSVVVVSFSTFG